MRVDYGIFKGDALLHRGFLVITSQKNIESSKDFKIRHRILNNTAELIVELFHDGERLTKSTLNMPIHESEDWESIELAQFTFAFKCTLDT